MNTQSAMGIVFPPATHTDKLGYPTAFSDVNGDGSEMWPFYPTPCCNAAATCDEQGYMVCKSCYHDVPARCGGMPQEPFTAIREEA